MCLTKKTFFIEFNEDFVHELLYVVIRITTKEEKNESEKLILFWRNTINKRKWSAHSWIESFLAYIHACLWHFNQPHETIIIIKIFFHRLHSLSNQSVDAGNQKFQFKRMTKNTLYDQQKWYINKQICNLWAFWNVQLKKRYLLQSTSQLLITYQSTASWIQYTNVRFGYIQGYASYGVYYNINTIKKVEQNN